MCRRGRRAPSLGEGLSRPAQARRRPHAVRGPADRGGHDVPDVQDFPAHLLSVRAPTRGSGRAMRRGHTLLAPSRPPRRHGVTLDTVAIVPASLVRCKATDQAIAAIANARPRDAVLLVLPTADTPETRLLQTAADRFTAKGRHVTTITDAS